MQDRMGDNYKENNNPLPPGKHQVKVFWAAPKLDKRGNVELRIGVSNDKGVAWKSLQFDGYTTDRQRKYVAAQTGNLLRYCGTPDLLTVDVTNEEFNGKVQTNFNILKPEEASAKDGAVEQYGDAAGIDAFAEEFGGSVI